MFWISQLLLGLACALSPPFASAFALLPSTSFKVYRETPSVVYRAHRHKATAKASDFSLLAARTCSDELVACARVVSCASSDGVLFLRSLFVAPRWRRQGLGILMAAAATELKLPCYTFPFEELKPLYKAAGFTTSGLYPSCIRNEVGGYGGSSGVRGDAESQKPAADSSIGPSSLVCTAEACAELLDAHGSAEGGVALRDLLAEFQREYKSTPRSSNAGSSSVVSPSTRPSPSYSSPIHPRPSHPPLGHPPPSNAPPRGSPIRMQAEPSAETPSVPPPDPPLTPPLTPPSTLPELSLAAIHRHGVRYRCRVLYDGEEFGGMQTQPKGHAVANCLEAALHRRLGCADARVCAASRTDAGVHARGQTIHFDLAMPASRLPAAGELERALNAMLPASVRVWQVEEAPEVDLLGRPWNARLSSAGKLYSYRLCVDSMLDPLERRQRLHVPKPLDLGLMREAAGYLTGVIDCAALANRRAGEVSPLQMESALTMRVVRAIEIEEEDGAAGHVLLNFHVKSAYYKMVRNLVGLLLAVGSGEIAPGAIPTLLAMRERKRMPPTAPAHALTLESVFYNAGWDGAYSHPLHAERVCEAPAGGECELEESSVW